MAGSDNYYTSYCTESSQYDEDGTCRWCHNKPIPSHKEWKLADVKTLLIADKNGQIYAICGDNQFKKGITHCPNCGKKLTLAKEK